MNSDGERGYIPRHSHTSSNNNNNNYNNSKINSNGGSNNDIGSNSANINNYEKPQQLQTQQQQQQQQQHERYVWEIRKRSPNTTPASTVLNSPDLADIHYNTQNSLNNHHHHLYHHHSHSHPPHQIRVGRSPVSGGDDCDDNINNQLLLATSPGSPTDLSKSTAIGLVREGEIVVFDDIDTNWKKTIVSGLSSINHDNEYHHQCQQQQQQSQHQSQQQQQLYTHHQSIMNDDVLKVTKMIGQLPIAEYEGSPRRIGNHQQQYHQQYELSQQQQQQNSNSLINSNSNYGTKNSTTTNIRSSPSLFPPRPGFPQRISPPSSSSSNTNAISNTLTDVITDNTTTNGLISILGTNIKQKQKNLVDITENSDDTNFCNNDTEEYDDDDDNNKPKTPTFDYLYEFSETRKVLEEFFKGSNDEDNKKFCDLNESDDLGSCDTHQECKYQQDNKTDLIEHSYIGQRLARIPNEEFLIHKSPRKQQICDDCDHNDIELYIDSNSRSSGELADTEFGMGIGSIGISNTMIDGNYINSSGIGGISSVSGGGVGGVIDCNMVRRHSRNFTLSPETTDYDSNCGDLDSLSNDINLQTDFGRLYTSMPVLEDGLSSGHASDTENNLSTAICIDKKYIEMTPVEDNITTTVTTVMDNGNIDIDCMKNDTIIGDRQITTTATTTTNNIETIMSNSNNIKNLKENNFDSIYSMNILQCTPPPPAPAPHRLPPINDPSSPTSVIVSPSLSSSAEVAATAVATAVAESQDIQEALKDIRSALHHAKSLPAEKTTKLSCDEVIQGGRESPIWVPRRTLSHESLNTAITDQQCQKQQQQPQEQSCHDDDDADTDLETDRLLGQQRLDDQGFYDDKNWSKSSSRLKSPLNSITGGGSNGSVITSPTSLTTTTTTSSATSAITTIKQSQTLTSATIRQGVGTSLTPTSPDHCQIIGSVDISLTSPEKLQFTKSPSGSIKSKKDTSPNAGSINSDKKSKVRNKEGLLDPAVLIEGVLFRARYLGSTQLVCEGQPTKSTRMMQAEEAVSRIKAPEGESQPSTEVDLFISTEKIMVLNTDLKEIMMDHALRTISYIADIGDLVVLMARRRFVPSDNDENIKPNRTPKMICHVFESDEAQFIAQSIGQAFQVAYMEFLKANGIEDHSFVKEMDYQEVLNSQEIFGDELEIFAKKELQKEVVVPKAKGEILGVVIVESGWGSMLPTVVIANLMSSGAAARCGQLNIGDQLIAINGMSLVGLPLSTCQSYIRNTKNQTAVKFTVVPCPPVVEVKIKRPNTKYQLGFSVQNGVICSLLRGGIAERGGVRVGHRIIEINNQSVVAVPHEKIVNLLATSVGEILMKTMPTSMFRLLTGQENPVYI